MDHDDVPLHVGRQDLAMVVRALVVIEEETLDPHEAVELDPLAKVFRMVPVDRADGQVGLHLLGFLDPMDAANVRGAYARAR